jgi:hypothetical protein
MPAWLVVGVLFFMPLPVEAQQSGEEVYRFACAACHAEDGRGEPRSVVGFDTPLPDFTDCAFTTSEADFDWNAVVHRGGPARGLDRRMPAFGEALSLEQIRHAIEYVRGFCRSRAWPHANLNLPRALVTDKAFPENEAIVRVRRHKSTSSKRVSCPNGGSARAVRSKLPFRST